jgi:hypothetical protein
MSDDQSPQPPDIPPPAEPSSDADALSAAEPARPSPNIGKRPEITISAFMRLLKLPTAEQVNLLQLQLEAQNEALQLINARLEKVLSFLETGSSGSFMERMEFQMNELRTLVRGNSTRLNDLLKRSENEPEG